MKFYRFPPFGAIWTVCALFLSSHPVQAQLLTAGYESQLETWLGQGNLNFTNIFQKITSNPGDAAKDAITFHSAADGKGATFTLLEISGAGIANQVIGGYNPQSWDLSGWHITNPDASRTAFIFNLTYSGLQRQNLASTGAFFGEIQTQNWYLGPTFGGGYDILTNYSLTTGSSYNYSYGGSSNAIPIVRGISGALLAAGSQPNFTISRMEVYTFSAAPAAPALVPVPEPSTYGLMGTIALLGLAGWRKRVQQRKQQKATDDQ